MSVAIGVDAHKSSLAAAALDELGRVVGVREFPNDARGHDALHKWSKAQGHERVIGIEGAGSFGAGLARHLLEADENVHEVPAFLTHRERKRNPSKGKSDPADAVAIARVVARGEGFPRPGARMCSSTSSFSPTTVTSSVAPHSADQPGAHRPCDLPPGL